MWVSRYTSAAKEVDHHGFCHHSCFLVWDSIGLQPLGELVHGDREVSVPLVTMWEGVCYVNDYPLEWCHNTVLMHEAPAFDWRAATGCEGVTVLVPLLNTLSCLEPVLPLPDFVLGFDTQESY
jgi:hypothetical protein